MCGRCTVDEHSFIDSMYECETGDQVDALLKKRGIREDDYQGRIDCLCCCLGNPQTFFAGPPQADEKAELRSQYITLRSSFVTGSWRAKKQKAQNG